MMRLEGKNSTWGKLGGQRDVFLVFLLITISGNPAFYNDTVSRIGYPLMLPIILYLLRGRISYRFLKRYLVIFTIFAGIFAAHQINLGYLSYQGAIGFLLKIFLGGLIISTLKDRFAPVFYRVVYYIALLSLLMYGIQQLIPPQSYPDIVSLYANREGLERFKSAIIHTVITDHWYRNAGMMWEPGAFQGLINLAILLTPLNILIGTHERNKRFAVLVVALITTFSTTGYLIFIVVMAVKALESRIGVALRIIMLTTILAVGTVAYFSLDFLGEKISTQYQEAMESERFRPDRFGAFIFDISYIQKNPLFGNGMDQTTRYADHPELIGIRLGHGNGFSNFTATMGVAGISAYLLALLFSRLSTSLATRFYFMLVIILLLQGQQFLNYPLFLGLPFLYMRPSGADNHYKNVLLKKVGSNE
jgi:hypothetical protein